jgi:GNAT superfamily N-acetyltransferase
VLIRPAQPDDAPAIESLYRELVTNPRIAVNPQRVADIAIDPKSFLLVAQGDLGEGGSVLGTVFMTICPDPMFDDACYALLEDVIVTARARNRGVGLRLLEEVELIARRERCNRLMLLSSSHRTDAHRFFRRAGFDGERKRGFVKYLLRTP